MESIPPPAAEWSLPTRNIGRRVLYFDRLPSTMAAAAALAVEPGTAILAGEQTMGRGQYGRSWQCPPSAGVLLAVAVAPPPPARRPAVLTAWAAVSVAKCVQQLTDMQPTIKWPNDVLIRGKKTCGILIESSAGPSPTAIAGIGLNVMQSKKEFTAAGLPNATSLTASTGRAFETLDVARLLLEELDRAYGLLDSELPALEAAWAEGIGLRGQPVVAKTADGTIHRGRLRSLKFDELELDGVDGTITRLAPEAVRSLVHGPVGKSPTQQT